MRDNIHSYDLIQSFEAFRGNPRPGEVYNLGGGRENSVSILEAFDIVLDFRGHQAGYSQHIVISNTENLKKFFYKGAIYVDSLALIQWCKVVRRLERVKIN